MPAEVSGSLTPSIRSTTVSGNRAYVAYQRSYGQSQKEVVVYRLTEASTWQRVRRVGVSGFGSWMLVISDGTVFIRENDPLTTFDERIRAILPSGEDVVVWREADQTRVRAHHYHVCGDWRRLSAGAHLLCSGILLVDLVAQTSKGESNARGEAAQERSEPARTSG